MSESMSIDFFFWNLERGKNPELSIPMIEKRLGKVAVWVESVCRLSPARCWSLGSLKAPYWEGISLENSVPDIRRRYMYAA